MAGRPFILLLFVENKEIIKILLEAEVNVESEDSNSWPNPSFCAFEKVMNR